MTPVSVLVRVNSKVSPVFNVRSKFKRIFPSSESEQVTGDTVWVEMWGEDFKYTKDMILDTEFEQPVLTLMNIVFPKSFSDKKSPPLILSTGVLLNWLGNGVKLLILLTEYSQL